MEAGPLRGKILVKQRKQPWGGQAAIYQIHRVSARLRLSSLSHSSLRPPLLWGNRVDLYEIWSVSAKTSSLRNLSCPTWLSLLCCNPPSCSPSLNCISASYLHFHITLSCALALSSSQESIFNGFPPAFLVHADPSPALSFYLCMMQLEGRTLWLKRTRLWELHVCQQDAPAWQFSNLLPEIAFWAVRGPHTVGLAQIQEHVTVHVY